MIFIYFSNYSKLGSVWRKNATLSTGMSRLTKEKFRFHETRLNKCG